MPNSNTLVEVALRNLRTFVSTLRPPDKTAANNCIDVLAEFVEQHTPKPEPTLGDPIYDYKVVCDRQVNDSEIWK